MIHTNTQLEKKSKSEELKLLFVSSEFYLKSGKEVIEAMKKINNDLIKLTIITQIGSIKKSDLIDIRKDNRINLIEFNLTFIELEEIYKNSNVLLHPTRQDSFALVVLEAIKYGIPCIGTNIYAIPEMIEDKKNGFLIKPRFLFFNENNMPNPNVWNNRKKTIYNEYCDEKIVEFLIKKILIYYNNRELLFDHSKNSYLKSINEEFSSENIKVKWLNLIGESCE